MEKSKYYESPEMEIILVDDSDVITASGPATGGSHEDDDPFNPKPGNGFTIGN